MALPEIPDLDINPPAQRYAYNIAIVINNVVHQVLNVPGSQAAMFMAQPQFVQVDPSVLSGYLYNPEDGTFSPQGYIEEEA